MKADLRSHLRGWIGKRFQAGAANRLQRGYFRVLDRFRNLSETHDRDNARRLENRLANARIETAENVTGEQRALKLLDPIRPQAAGWIEGQEVFESGGPQRL